MRTIKLAVLVFVFMIHQISSRAQDKIKARDSFNWLQFDTTSTIDINSINAMVIQGNWIYNEFHCYSDYNIGTVTKQGQAGLLEIKGDKYRKTLTGNYYDYHIYKNLIVFETDTKPVSGYVNRISNRELIISFRDSLDFIQIFYKK
jgi:hypothetical protein